LNEALKEKAGLVYNVVESVILAMSVGLMVWLSNVVIGHGNDISRISTRQQTVYERVDRLETIGSPSLVAHERSDEQRVTDIKLRVDKLEAAVIVLQGTPGELKAIGVSLQTLHEGQKRIEERLDKVTNK
jgi:hypothetical protein